MERSMGMRFRERVATLRAAKKEGRVAGGGRAARERPVSSSRKKFDEAMWKKQVLNSRCSAVVTLAKDRSNFFVGHTTWSDYSEMLRMYKHYDLPVGDGTTRRMSFSSYPGMISSTDDWYLLSSKIMILETTMNIENEELYEKLDPAAQVVSWVRTLVANRLAKSAREWSDTYAQHNSGTYNCMWLLFDLNRFVPEAGKGPQKDFFIMTEQIPGQVRTEDMTDLLVQRSYFPSVNRPYFEDIRKAAGYPRDDPQADNNDFFSFENNPRGREFKQRHHLVTSVDTLGSLMRYNGYPNDPTQLNKPGHAIAARFDEQGEPGRRPVGGTDSKVTDFHLASQMTSKVITGPTTEYGQPPFRWTDAPDFQNVVHEGLDQCWDFQWQTFSPFKSIQDTGSIGYKPGSKCNE
jgi:hypothetical protein